MNRDVIEPVQAEPVGRVGPCTVERASRLDPCAHFKDGETHDPTYDCYTERWTRLPVIVHRESQLCWSPSWRTLVSLAEREGLSARPSDAAENHQG